MNTLASSQTQAILSAPQTRKSQSGILEEAPRRSNSVLFILLSAGVHLGALSAFAATPQPKARPLNPASELAIEFEPIVELPEPESVLPLGDLDAHPEAETLTPPSPQARPAQTPSARQPSASPSVDKVGDAPNIVTVDNPYATADAVFSKGSGDLGAKKVRAVARTREAQPDTVGFGVPDGRRGATEEGRRQLSEWKNKVSAQLARSVSRNYPRRARKLGQQGTSKISVRISATGELQGASLLISSGHALLDQAALRDMRRAGQVEAPPQGAGTITLNVPITYRLN